MNGNIYKENLKVIVFSYGEMGKKLVQICHDYCPNIDVIAVSDNTIVNPEYTIKYVPPKSITELEYDEIWIASAYYQEIREQLMIEYGVSERYIWYMDPVAPVLEKKIYEKYFLDDIHTFSNAEFLKEISYVKKNHLRMYCYPFYDEYLLNEPDVYFDDDAELFYGIYEGKRLYLSKKFDTIQKCRKYLNEMYMEQDDRCPHCYWQKDGLSDNIGGIVVDVGAAEGIFGLRIIENVSHIYLVEPEDGWEEALRLTFKDYIDKVTIISKYVSDKSTSHAISLDEYFENIDVEVIKMDIEGMEPSALKGGERLIKRCHPQMAICAYHNSEDYDDIRRFLNNNYELTDSQGYVICIGDWEIDNDNVDFRKAIIFAK